MWNLCSGVCELQLLEDRIRKDGKIKSGDVLRVDGFLNHMIDVRFVAELGAEFHRLFADCRVNKILTIESSGIGVACLTAQFFDCPVVFAKKSKTSNMDGDSYRVQIASYTHGNVNDVVVSKEYLGKGDRVLIIDDFLARGNAQILLQHALVDEEFPEFLVADRHGVPSMSC